MLCITLVYYRVILVYNIYIVLLIVMVNVLTVIYFIQAACNICQSVPCGLSSAPLLLGLSLCQHMLGLGWDDSLCICLCRCLVRGPIGG